MNSIKLTNTQKLHVLFMCKKLFPEYDNIRFGTSVMTTSKDYLYFHKNKNKHTIEIINIHWFEFCMTYLVEKIYYPNMENIGRATREKVEYFLFQSFIDSTEGESSGYDHPVDYLYKEFLKLKL